MNVSLYTTHSIYNKKKHYIIYLKYLSVLQIYYIVIYQRREEVARLSCVILRNYEI